MDPSLEALSGPKPVQTTGVVSVPRDLLKEIGVEAGAGKVHWALNPDIPGTLLLIPAQLVARAMPDLLEALRRVSR